MTLTIKLKQQIALGLCAALAVLVGITLIYSLWQWHSDWVIAHAQSNGKPAAIANNNTDIIARVSDEHLFGQSFEKTGDVPVTNLGFHVTGIVKEEGGKNPASKVYISISGQPSKIYQSGDSLPYGVKIYDITPDTVILENNGHLEKLPLPREKLEFKPRNLEEQM